MHISVSSLAGVMGAGMLAASLTLGTVRMDAAPTSADAVVAAPEVQEPSRDQIRMEQTVIIRVPRAAPPKGKAKAFKTNFKEHKIGGCVTMKKIAGVRVAGDQTLELLTVDGQLVRAYLNKGCEAREFYSGFYIEKPGDGQFCKDREVLHARSGAECRVAKFRLLKAK